MSVIDKNKIDSIGINKSEDELLLMIADHLDWNNELEHLTILQNKINSYLGYIEAKEYNNIYPNDKFKSYIIEIHFKYKITDKCKQFLNVAQKQVQNFNIKFAIIEVND